MRIGQAQIQGARDNQEDFFGCVGVARGWLAIVADGMGGHDRGEVASRVAVDTAMRTVMNGPALRPDALVRSALENANRAVVRDGDELHSDMAAVAVAALVADNTAYISWAGDARAYGFRANGEQVFVTADHSTPGGALLNFIGMRQKHGQFKTQDMTANNLHTGDVLCLCSDGVSNTLKGDALRQAFVNSPAWGTNKSELLAESVMNAVIKERNPRQDNATLVVIIF